MTDVSVHLFLEKSGALSADITAMNEFMSHNYRPIGDGLKDGEVFHDFLIKIHFEADEEQYQSGEVSKATLIRQHDRTIVLEHSLGDIHIGTEKRITKAIWVSGHECKRLLLKVTSKDNSIEKRYRFIVVSNAT